MLEEDNGKGILLEAYQATMGLQGQRQITSDVHELIDKVASAIQQQALARVRAEGVFHLALSGGSTPQALYQHLMIDPRYRFLPWAKTHLWLVDDRCVGFDDEKSNYRMIRELIVDHVHMPPEQVHPMPVLEADGDRRYESDLRAALGDEGRLDYTLLGMGPDAHTASLFPHTPGIGEQARWVIFNDGEHVVAPRPRLTMTFPLINRSRQVAILVTGASKNAMLKRVAREGGPVEVLPVTGVKPLAPDTQVTWYLDRAAALGA